MIALLIGVPGVWGHSSLRDEGEVGGNSWAEDFACVNFKAGETGDEEMTLRKTERGARICLSTLFAPARSSLASKIISEKQ